MGNVKSWWVSNKNQTSLLKPAKKKRKSKKLVKESLWSSTSQFSGEISDKSWNLWKHEENIKTYEFYKTPEINEMLDFEVDWSSEQALVDKCKQMQDDITEIKSKKISLRSRLAKIDPNDKFMEKLLIFIDKGYITKQSDSEYQVWIMQNLSSQVLNDHPVPDNLPSNVTLNIDNTSYPAKYTTIECNDKSINDYFVHKMPKKLKTLSTTNSNRLFDNNSSIVDKWNVSQMQMIHKPDFLRQALALKSSKENKQSKLKPPVDGTHRKSKSTGSKMVINDYYESSGVVKDETQDLDPIETQLVLLEYTKSLRLQNLSNKLKYQKQNINNYNRFIWKEMHYLYFHPEWDQNDKTFTLSFVKRKSKSEAHSIGKERTFSLSQFEGGKIYTFDIKFQKHFESQNYANISVKIQYVKDEERLITEILELYDQKQQFLATFLEKCSERIYELNRATFRIDKSKRKSQFAGWYQKSESDKFLPNNSNFVSVSHEKSFGSKPSSFRETSKHSNNGDGYSYKFEENELNIETASVVERRESILNWDFSEPDKISI